MRGELEAQLSQHYRAIAGVDEVGRGCLAGPVYAAAVILNYPALQSCTSEQLSLLRDSKSLSAAQRQTMLPFIDSMCLTKAVAHASVREIEDLGIVPATFLAMTRALEHLQQKADFLLIDGRAKHPTFKGPQQAVIKGDSLCYCIAAASIIAKEARDAYMREIAEDFPHYGFAKHVGYGTRDHLAAIDQHGVCTLHRRNFAPIRQLIS